MAKVEEEEGTELILKFPYSFTHLNNVTCYISNTQENL